jgi:hypothetical protein
MTGLRLLAAALLLWAASGNCMAKPSWAEYLKSYKLLESGAFTQLEALHARSTAIKDVDDLGYTEVEKFFDGLVVGAHSITSQPSVVLEHARQWVKASPDSMAAAIVLGRLTIQWLDSWFQKKPSWAEQERLIAEARQQMERFKERGKNHPEWHSAYIRLMALNGAGPSQVMESTKLHLQGQSIPGRLYFADIVQALDIGTSGAFPQLRELAVLASQKSGQRDGLAMYAVVYLAAFDFAPNLRTDFFRPEMTDWRTLDSALIDLEKHYPANWQRHYHAALSCQARDKARASVLFSQLSRPDVEQSELWKSRLGGEAVYNRCKSWALGRSEPT